MKPSIGRIVHYILSSDDATAIRRRRVPNVEHVGHGESWPAGAQAHVGNPVTLGEHVPMIVCVVWPNEYGPDFDGVNGQVFLDGNDSYWVTSAKEGTEPGTWHWPERSPQSAPEGE